MAEHVLGKDEVAGSSPADSSRFHWLDSASFRESERPAVTAHVGSNHRVRSGGPGRCPRGSIRYGTASQFAPVVYWSARQVFNLEERVQSSPGVPFLVIIGNRVAQLGERYRDMVEVASSSLAPITKFYG